jgi:hypothetical protein
MTNRNRVLTILAPTLRETGNGHVALVARISESGQDKELYFEVEKSWGDYLDIDSADAFVCALLYYCMVKGYDVESESPISERLCYQLTTYFIPVLVGNTDFFKQIEIKAPTVKGTASAVGVGTGISGGVDSLYTIHKYINHPLETYRLTHLLFTDMPAYQDVALDTQEKIDNCVNEWLAFVVPLAKEVGLPLIYIGTNLERDFVIDEIVSKRHGIFGNSGLYALKYSSIAFALQKLFGVYYFSSAYSADEIDFHPTPYDAAYYDIFNMPNISTERLLFYSAGCEMSRFGKVQQIADWSVAQEYLRVCAANGPNCGSCKKCIRTEMELWTIGKLDDFNKVFDVAAFNLNFRHYAARTIGHKHDVFAQDTMREIKLRADRHIPISSRIEGAFIICMEVVKKLLLKHRKNRLLRYVYHATKLDLLINGSKSPDPK